MSKTVVQAEAGHVSRKETGKETAKKATKLTFKALEVNKDGNTSLVIQENLARLLLNPQDFKAGEKVQTIGFGKMPINYNGYNITVQLLIFMDKDEYDYHHG